MFKKGEKITLLRPYTYREICEGFQYTETLPPGTVCEYVTKREKESFIPEWQLKQKYFDTNWNVLNDEGLTIPAAHVLQIPLKNCNELIYVKDDFLIKYFKEEGQDAK